MIATVPRGSPAPSPSMLIILLLGLLAFPVHAKEYFQACAKEFNDGLASGNQTIIGYNYTFAPLGILPGHKAPNLITYDGCVALCGGNPKFYPWAKVSDTITTWVLPLAGGLLLQLPFSSNKRFSTLLTLCRWLGSPIASLMYILWNIKVTGRCALIVDMSVPRGGPPGNPRCSARNRTANMWNTIRKEFSNDRDPGEVSGWPQLSNLNETEKREAEAFAELRDSMYILSVFNQFAFNHEDPSRTADILEFALFSRANELPIIRQELATSLRRDRKHGVVQVLLSIFWFLVALAISIFKAFGELGDNSTAHNLALGLLMSWLPVLTSTSLVDRNPTSEDRVRIDLAAFLRESETRRLHVPGNIERMLGRFGGQAREKWHYGIAHSILSNLERNLDDNQRNERQLHRVYWAGEFVTRRVGNSVPHGDLWTFDLIEIWQMCTAGLIVTLSAFGAFCISYYTPTVGLGCRSGGYMTYGVLVAGCFFFDLLGWRATKNGWAIVCLRVFLTFLEICNSIWLVYIILAQTFGIYNSCACKSSIWSRGKGGYTDFAGTSVYRDDYDVRRWWIFGTVLGSLPLLSIFHIVYQWLSQSFLWTEDYEKAVAGLRRVRVWRYFFHSDWAHAFFILLPYKLFSKTYKGITWRR
ncbi:hypothetical protein V498_07360 [Pseudogymnoascus sp. VKM F-4517 (FW-2822)]|nr:hypothetical protein V498_07360 [Pseudogymnoascus sp. VKM F-4517 (FW-2822)]